MTDCLSAFCGDDVRQKVPHTEDGGGVLSNEQIVRDPKDDLRPGGRERQTGAASVELEYYSDAPSRDDMVFWHGKDKGVSYDDADFAKVDTIITGPHAGASFPVELKPFVSPLLTRRNQYDFSDVATGPVGRAWASIDERVVFVQNCAPRVVTDANRALHDDNPEPALREFFRRRHAGLTSYAGVDSVRPVTFNNIPVLREPESPADWEALVGTIKKAREKGPTAYYHTLDAVVDRVIESRAFTDDQPLTLVCLHDTDAFKCAADGSLSVARPPKDNMPDLVCLGNAGDASGAGASLSMPKAELVRMAGVWAKAFGYSEGAVASGDSEGGAVYLNRPYKKGFESTHWPQHIREKPKGPRTVHAVQVEFLRKVLHGPRVDVELRKPGVGYPQEDREHAKTVAEKLKWATDRLRDERSHAEGRL
eukprot:1012706-Prymnesium_polylepis.1